MSNDSPRTRNGISRRRFLTSSAHMAGALGLGTTLQATTARATKRKPPNILMIMSDQERSFSCLPSELDLPGHEFLMKQGVAFKNHHVNTGPCSPSRSVIYTGKHTMETGISANLHMPPFTELQPEIKTLGHYLQEQGYYTAYKGKWHLHSIDDGPGLMYGPYPTRARALEAFGFDDYNLAGDVHGSVWAGRQMDNIIASEACAWLNQRDSQDKPWFLAVNFVNPHDIMFYSTGAEQANSRLGRDTIAPLKGKPSHPLYQKDWSHIGLPENFSDDLKDKPWSITSFADSLDDIFGHIAKDNEAAWLDQQSYYFNCLRDVSRQVELVISQLAAIGELDNTIIVYTSDHGEMAGAHGLRQKGPMVFKENTNVPLIIRHPDIQEGHISDNLSSAVDLVPTLLELTGMERAKIHERYPELKGHSVAPGLVRQKSQRDQAGHLFAYGVLMYIDPATSKQIMSENLNVTPFNILRKNLENGRLLPNLENKALHRGIYDGRYKFTRYFAADSHHIPTDIETLKAHNELELYDTLNDPGELNNLAITAPDWKLIETLNQQLNQLIHDEIGADVGKEFPGPEFLYTL